MHIEEQLRRTFTPGQIVDGELMSDAGFNTTSGWVRQQSRQAIERVNFHMFDMPHVPNDTQAGRRLLLQHMVDHAENIPHLQITDRRRIASPSEAEGYYRFCRAFSHEGIILKDPAAPYHNKRHKSWLKLKDMLTTEVMVEDVVEGLGKYRGMLGAFTCRTYWGTVISIGGGFTDAQRQVYWEQRHAATGMVLEVAYHELTPDGTLRHPRFLRARNDMTPADFERQRRSL